MNSYLHVDLDAFFASVEQLDNPELRGKPVIVGGRPEDRRSVVSTASYEARAFGVHSAMPTFQAYRLCPQGIFVHGRMHRYAELSHQIMNIFRDYSPDVDQMSIDEAFIDLTGTEKLFGPPEETARKIKARVKEETGLTVSVGLASTKYLAKIASGLSKPDGFYIIRPGTEESFMLKLPLNKVWGLGPKSLELIRSKGLNSTRDIYERDYESLEFLFGKNMASFLYNVVRGNEKESFSRESKSHSISAETTFPYDLTDIYTIETELLELAHGVFFRLLKEEGFSRTAFVKIRYDDFSTGTIQETLERNIITLDSYFEIIKRLFEKRYEKGRGIRLLGVGFENIVKEEKPYQQDLFDTNNDEKKQAVEKAILKLSKKHPEIKVSKARTLKALLLAALIGTAPASLKAQEAPQEPPPIPDEEEAPVYLFDYDIDDKNHVDFSASGLWKIEFTTGMDFTFGNGTDFAASPSLPIFKQETDISTLLTLNNHWYFEAAFADEFTRNTFAFGYRGDQLIRHFRLANRGITMNEGYSAEHFGYAVRGGNNEAPGMLLQLVSPSEKVSSDFLVRYDMTESKSQIYYGMNKVSDIKIRAEDFAYGREFRFPQGAAQALADIKDVYIESSAGSYQDAGGKIYRRLRKDEYALQGVSRGNSGSRLYISQEAGGGKTAGGDIPSILITFNGSALAATVVSAAGSWDDSSSFFGQIQSELGNNGEYKLQNFCGDFVTKLEGENALIIQSSTGFSPFLCPSLYDFGSKKDADFLVISDKSEMPVTKYQAIEAEEIYTKLYENYFYTKQLSVRVLNKESSQSVYPFAQDCPEIYLGKAQKTNLSVRARSYSPVNEIIISKKASAGTVQVYRNGNLMSGTVFDENTGIVTLNAPVSQTDQLLVTWQEEASDFAEGAVTAAAGVKFNFIPQLSADLSLTTRQPVSKEDTLIENGSQKNSFTALSGGITWSDYGFTLKEKASVSLLNDNTAQGLVLYSWKEIWDDYIDEKESSTESERQKLTEPEKSSSISFEKQDFSSYKKINVELAFLGEGFSGPFTLTLDEDTGTALSGRQALLLYISEIEKYAALGGKHTITICLEKETGSDEKEVLFDGHTLSKKDYTLKVNKNVIPSRLTLEIQDTSENHKPVVQELSYTEAKYYATFRNYAAAQYKKDGELMTVKDFPILKDFYASAESDQGSGSFTEPQPFVSLKTQGGITAAGLKLSGDLSMQDLTQSADLQEAGHSVKTDSSLLVFKLFSAEDTYRYRPASEELQKSNAFALDIGALPLPVKIPFKASLNTSASKGLMHEKQNAEITAGYSQKIFDGSAGLNTKLQLSQKLDTKPDKSEANYAEGWTNISRLAFSDGKEEAQNRSSLWGASLNGSIPFMAGELTMNPKLTYELSDSYQRSQTDGTDTPLFTDKEFLSLLLPFNANKNSFSFEIARTGGGNKETEKGGSYAEDSQKLFDLQKERSWFYSSIPFYELFDAGLKEKVSLRSGYAAKYEGNFRRSLFNSTKDIIVPSALTLALTREITRQLPESDLYQLKAVITNNSLNNFGSDSNSKLFDWFKQEELTTTLTTIFKIPAAEPENLKINIQAYAQLLLFITEKTILTEQFDFSIENHANWNVRDTLAYTRPSNTSLMTFFAHLIVPSSDNSAYAITRKDSLSAELGKNDAQLQQKYSYSHTVGVDFLEYYNVNAALGGTLILNEKKADSLNISLTLGAKAEF